MFKCVYCEKEFPEKYEQGTLIRSNIFAEKAAKNNFKNHQNSCKNKFIIQKIKESDSKQLAIAAIYHVIPGISIIEIQGIIDKYYDKVKSGEIT